MFRASELNNRAKELGKVIRMLADEMDAVRGAFVHQDGARLGGVEKRCADAVEEMAFAAVEADKAAYGKPVRARRPYRRYQSALTHLRLVALTIAELQHVVAEQISARLRFSESGFDQVEFLMTSQVAILQSMADAATQGDKEYLKKVRSSCREMGSYCLKFANHHETRMVGGLCQPSSAPAFLSIIDRVQTMIHHERETVRLMLHPM